MIRPDVERIVYAGIGAGLTINDSPDRATERFLRNAYPGGLAAVAEECGVSTVRPELVDLLAWRGRELWAQHQIRHAARAALQAGCPLRVAAEAAGVSHQTIANWAAAAD